MLRHKLPVGIKKAYKIVYSIIFIFIFLFSNSISADWPNCGFQCKADDVQMTKAYLGDAIGNSLGSCSAGSSQTAYLWITIYNNAGQNRYAMILLTDVIINNQLYKTTYDNGICVLDSITPKATTSKSIYSFPWTCGQPIRLERMILSWETASGTTCTNVDRQCSNRGTKCYGGTLTSMPVETPLVADFTSNSPRCCCGISFFDKTSGGTSPYTFEWNFGDGSAKSSLQNPVHIYSSPGSYSVTLKVTDLKGSTSTITRQIVLYAPPTADAGRDLSIKPGGSKNLEGAASGGTPPYSYAWSPGTGLDNAYLQRPRASPTKTTKYSLKVTDSYGCNSSDSMNLFVSSLNVSLSASKQIINRCDEVIYTYKIGNPGYSDLNAVSLADSVFGSLPGPFTGDINGDGLLNPTEIWTYQFVNHPYVNITNYALSTATDPTGMQVSAQSAVVKVNVTSTHPEVRIDGNNITCINLLSKYVPRISGACNSAFRALWKIDGLATPSTSSDNSLIVDWKPYLGGYHLLRLTVDFTDERGNIWYTGIDEMNVLVVDVPNSNIEFV
jgi:PKD repeat protein